MMNIFQNILGISLNKLFSAIILLSIIGCAANPSQTYNNLSSAYKAKAVAVNLNNQVTGGWGVSGGYSQSEANLKAIRACKNYNSQYECIVEMEGSNYVLIKNILEKNEQREKAYLLAKQNICKGYGFEAQNAIAICVQKEIANDKLYANNRNNQNTQRSSVNWSALSELGATLTNQANNNTYKRKLDPAKRTYFLKNNYMDGMNRVCVYDGWTETINGIGLCQLTITR